MGLCIYRSSEIPPNTPLEILRKKNFSMGILDFWKFLFEMWKSWQPGYVSRFHVKVDFNYSITLSDIKASKYLNKI